MRRDDVIAELLGGPLCGDLVPLPDGVSGYVLFRPHVAFAAATCLLRQPPPPLARDQARRGSLPLVVNAEPPPLVLPMETCWRGEYRQRDGSSVFVWMGWR